MVMDLLTLDPTEQEIQDWCAAVRLTTLGYAGTAQGLRGWTDAQRRTLQELFGEFCGKDRTLRLAMGNYIFETSGLTGLPLTSFNDLSEAQASALIDHVWGLSRGERYRHEQATQVLHTLVGMLQGAVTRPEDINYLFDL